MIPELTENDKKRFWVKVDIRGPDNCWNWLGLRAVGYGKFMTGMGWCLDARYIAAESTRYDLLAWHRCHNKRCCNPNHIRVGTRAEKILDGFYTSGRHGPVPDLVDADKDRFWSKIDIQDWNDCWPWTDFRDKSHPYGLFFVDGVAFRPHRVAYSLVSRSPEGKAVCHGCDDPACCNPEHLWLGTDKENNRDMVNKGRQRVLRGSACSHAKLTEDDILQIRERVERGQSQRDLARLYPVTSGTINAIVKRKTWTHI